MPPVLNIYNLENGNSMMVIKDGLVFIKEAGDFVKTDIKIKQGRIVDIKPNIPAEGKILPAGNLQIFPGMIDPHVHLNDPGFNQRETFLTGTSAAAAGGVTTIVDMPCTSNPVIINLANLNIKLKQVADRAVVDYGFFGGVSGKSYSPRTEKDIGELASRVLGIKTYFHSSDKNYTRVNHYQFQHILAICKSYKKPVLLHAEDHDFVKHAQKTMMDKGNRPEDYYLSRPETAELLAVQNAIALNRNVQANLHIVHLATGEASDLIQHNPATGETAAHYLAFDLGDFISQGASLKVAPCIKPSKNKKHLWKNLQAGIIDYIASDHAPCPPTSKQSESVWEQYSGIPGLETSLLFLYSEGLLKKRISLSRFVEVTSSAAAHKFGLEKQKGGISVGRHADLVLIDPNKTTVVKGTDFFSKGKITPFEGWKFKGKIINTVVRGEIVFDHLKGICVDPGYGKYVGGGRN